MPEAVRRMLKTEDWNVAYSATANKCIFKYDFY